MRINKQFLKQLNPCRDRWANFLQHYSDWEGSFSEFLELDKISLNDKLWVFFKENKELESIQREFSLTVSAICADESGIQELIDYHNLITIIYISSSTELIDSEEYYMAHRAACSVADRADYRAAYWAAYWAAHSAADSAAHRAACSAADRADYRAAEREKQLKIVKSLCRGI